MRPEAKMFKSMQIPISKENPEQATKPQPLQAARDRMEVSQALQSPHLAHYLYFLGA